MSGAPTVASLLLYAINMVTQVSRPGYHTWHRLANADLLQILATCWDSNRFELRKVRSHQVPQDLPPGQARDDVIGNSWADHAAVRARLTDHTRVDALFQRAEIWHRDQFLQTKRVLAYLADLNLCHSQEKQKNQSQIHTDPSHDATLDWGNLYRSRATYKAPAPAIILRPSIHPAFVTACVWGAINTPISYFNSVLHFVGQTTTPRILIQL